MSKTEQAPPRLFKPASVKPRPVPEVPALSALSKFVDPNQIENALGALLQHVERKQHAAEQDSLLGAQDEKLFLTVGLRKPPRREVHKPIRLCVPAN